MEFTVHHQVLGAVFIVAVIMGAVVNKTHFCTMGAVSDWVNIGDTGRMRAWVFAMAVALLGVIALEATGAINLSSETFPPYRSANFAWPRYLVGGLMFGIGMVLASAECWRMQFFGTKGMAEVGAIEHLPTWDLTLQMIDQPREVRKFSAERTEKLELEAFARAIEAGQPYVMPVEDILAGVCGLEAILQSIESGQPVKVAQ